MARPSRHGSQAKPSASEQKWRHSSCGHGLRPSLGGLWSRAAVLQQAAEGSATAGLHPTQRSQQLLTLRASSTKERADPEPGRRSPVLSVGNCSRTPSRMTGASGAPGRNTTVTAHPTGS